MTYLEKAKIAHTLLSTREEDKVHELAYMPFMRDTFLFSNYYGSLMYISEKGELYRVESHQNDAFVVFHVHAESTGDGVYSDESQIDTLLRGGDEYDFSSEEEVITWLSNRDESRLRWGIDNVLEIVEGYEALYMEEESVSYARKHDYNLSARYGDVIGAINVLKFGVTHWFTDCGYIKKCLMEIIEKMD